MARCSVHIARSGEDLAGCYPVMAQLRPHLTLESFLDRVQSQQAEGYKIAFVSADEEVVAVAGYRLVEMLAHGRFLYIDDLVTDERCRSHGYGSDLLEWLSDHATEQQCASVQLDSGVQRTGAHRFYDREGFVRTGYHFSRSVPQAPRSQAE